MEKINLLFVKFKSFIAECRRVLLVTKKPTGVEFKAIVKASGLGIAIIGLIGFLIKMGEIMFIRR